VVGNERSKFWWTPEEEVRKRAGFLLMHVTTACQSASGSTQGL
jgi:hypothetical protein